MTDQNKPFYITTPIFYPNGNLHIGNVYTPSVCDILARMARMVGRPTYFLTGADENTLKVNQVAKAEGKEVMQYLDEQAVNFGNLFERLYVSNDQYIRTTDREVHHPGVIEMWNRLAASGDIYESEYEGFYCAACEGFKTERDLIEGACSTHGTTAEFIKEKNYYFKLSKYTEPIKKLIQSGEFVITPEARKNEVLAHLEEGLTDTSFSRPYKGQPNAILVPGDESQNIYVWGDALTNYISALGFGTPEDDNFKKFWPATVQVMGKDIVRFHAEIWPAMLLSAGLPLPKELLVHGLLLSGGRKMGKTTGNTIDPLEMMDIVGAEGLRFFFAHDVSLTEDGEVSKDLFISSYNAHLANGIGNLCNRLLKMMISYDVQFDPEAMKDTNLWKNLTDVVSGSLEKLDLNGYSAHIWEIFAELDRKIQETEPFKLFKVDPESAKQIVKELMEKFYIAVNFAEPILPYSVPKIIKHIQDREMPKDPLFSKINI